jgi:ribonuclease HII
MKERNINHKQTSWAQIKATNEVVKGRQNSVSHLLLIRPVLARSKIENTRNKITYTTKGGTRLVAMVAIASILQLVHDLWGYDMEFQQKVVEKIF